MSLRCPRLLAMTEKKLSTIDCFHGLSTLAMRGSLSFSLDIALIEGGKHVMLIFVLFGGLPRCTYHRLFVASVHGPAVEPRSVHGYADLQPARIVGPG